MTNRRPDVSPRGGDRRYLVAAVGLVVLVTVLVLTLGVVRAPSLGLLKATGASAPGSVAWTQYNSPDGCMELRVARPDGSVDTLTCQPDLGDVVGWDASGITVVSWGPTGQMLETRDATTGEVLDSTAADGVTPVPPVTAGIATERVDGRLVVTLGATSHVLWDVKASRGYDIRSGVVSPDGDWVAMVDSMNRLILVPSVDSAAPIVWATGVEVSSWVCVVWEDAAA